jgi:signal transduction histidine kinase
MSLRVRLTLWTMAIFCVVEVALGYMFLLYQSRHIEDYFDGRLADKSQRLVTHLAPMLATLDDASLGDLVREEFSYSFSDQLAVTVLNERGDVVATSHRPPIILDERALRKARDAKGPVSIPLPATALGGTGEGNTKPRGLATRVQTTGGTYFAVLASQDLHAQNMLSLLTTAMLFALPIGLVATAISSYLISGIAVRPLAELLTMARRLSPESIGEHVEVQAASREMSDLRQELEKARERLAAGFAAQERFISNVSHEIKTPIAVVLTQIQVLPRAEQTAAVQEFVQSTTEELEKLSRTVDSFLLLTRVRHGKETLPKFDQAYMRDILLDSFEGCIGYARQHDVRLDLQIPEGEDADASVMGNADLLRTIVDNLVRNAVRYSPKESTVTVTALVEEGKMKVDVRDHGPGIPEALIPTLFDRFSKPRGPERGTAASGLGLAIAQGLAELHGGKIEAKNCPDGGSLFRLTLPLKVDDFAVEAPEAGVSR